MKKELLNSLTFLGVSDATLFVISMLFAYSKFIKLWISISCSHHILSVSVFAANIVIFRTSPLYKTLYWRITGEIVSIISSIFVFESWRGSLCTCRKSVGMPSLQGAGRVLSRDICKERLDMLFWETVKGRNWWLLPFIWCYVRWVCGVLTKDTSGNKSYQ